jgi:hypothetical protein
MTSPGASAQIDIDIPKTPVGDVVVVADSQGPGAGAHAEARYRLERAAAPAASSRPGGHDIRLAGRYLGTTLPITP